MESLGFTGATLDLSAGRTHEESDFCCFIWCQLWWRLEVEGQLYSNTSASWGVCCRNRIKRDLKGVGREAGQAVALSGDGTCLPTHSFDRQRYTQEEGSGRGTEAQLGNGCSLHPGTTCQAGREETKLPGHLEIWEVEGGRGPGGGKERKLHNAGGLGKDSSGCQLLQTSCVSGRHGHREKARLPRQSDLPGKQP